MGIVFQTIQAQVALNPEPETPETPQTPQTLNRNHLKSIPKFYTPVRVWGFRV